MLFYFQYTRKGKKEELYNLIQIFFKILTCCIQNELLIIAKEKYLLPAPCENELFMFILPSNNNNIDIPYPYHIYK